MEEQTPKREEGKETPSLKEKDLSDMQDIRKQRYEKAMNRLERFHKQYAPDHTVLVGKEKYIVGYDQYREPLVLRKEPLGAEEEKDMDEVRDALRGQWEFRHEHTIQENAPTDKDEPEC